MDTITIRKRLESDVINLGEAAKSMMGKNVEIIIRELADVKPKEKKWTSIGSVDLYGALDDLNIRDFANDD